MAWMKPYGASSWLAVVGKGGAGYRIFQQGTGILFACNLEGQPWENIDGYMRLSPVSLVGNIETPTLVMVGTSDLRTPLSEAKQLYSALKIRGIDTALVEVPGAPHNIAGNPSQLITKIDHILAWFAKYPPE